MMEDMNDVPEQLQTRELAELAGVTPRALRHYHQIGLLDEPPRSSNGYREYGIEDLVRVLRIKQLSQVGVPLRKIREILAAHSGLTGDIIDDIDRDLAAEAARIAEQRNLLSSLRRQTPQVVGLAGDGEIAKLDSDMWLLLTGTENAPGGIAESIPRALRDSGVLNSAGEWLTELEALGDQTEVENAVVEQLVHKMLDFARSVFAHLDLDEIHDSHPLAAQLEQLQKERLSPAQLVVWQRFQSEAEKVFEAHRDT